VAMSLRFFDSFYIYQQKFLNWQCLGS